MTWDEYYEKTNDWAVSTSVKKMSTLENVGAAREVTDVIHILASEDEKGATRLLNKAIQSGVKFSGEDLVDIWDLCDSESLNKAVQLSADKFTTRDLEDLALCADDEQIIEIAKRYKIGVPKDITDEYEEVLCPDTTTPISWSRFYEAYQEWSSDYAIKRVKSLSDFGDEDEVIEVVNELFMTDEKGASEFVRKAVEWGVEFNADNLIELSSLCDQETVKVAVLCSGQSLSSEDLEELYDFIEDEIIEAVAKQQNLKLPEDMREEEEDFVDMQDAIESAVVSANYALECLYQAQAAMNNSGNVSFWNMINPSKFRSIMKYNALVDAEQEIVNAQSALQSLNYELKWILRNKDVQLASNKLASVADMTFNSKVMDSLVHLQIGKSQHQISKAIRQVESVRQELVRMYKKSQMK